MIGRQTKTKRALLDLLGKTKAPLSVPEIVDKLGVNKTTIYRELAAFKDQVSEVDFGDGLKRYELTPEGHHHHAVCTGCQRVVELEIEPSIAKLESAVRKQSGFKLGKHLIEFFGTCKACAR